MSNKEYVRIEFSMGAVRAEDYRAIKEAIDSVRVRFCKSGSYFGVSSVTEGTKISDD